MTTPIIPPGYAKAEWDRYVRLGRKLVKQISGIQFALGDIVIDMLDGRDRGHGEVGEVIELFAHQIGVNADTLHTYYLVAQKWPQEKRRDDVPYTVHKELAYSPRRFAQIQRNPRDPFTGEERWTVNEAQRAAAHVPQTPTNREERLDKARRLLSSDEDAAEAVSELISRPDVRARVVSDQRNRHMLRQAQFEHWRQVDRGVEEAEDLLPADDTQETASAPEPTAPALGYQQAPLEILQLIGTFASFFVSLQRIIPAVHSQDYTEDTKEAVLDNVTKARSFLDWCESAITTGRTDMDQALARLLEDEGE
ncbi:hypothetical protein J2S46_000387 [Kitasatospora herbaricolor]|uniref:DUF6192 family protein n=1 Tax=Kitasatospora herbaricolor TaxID=68217 RepID=UPI001748D686|nr:DUF6192 family protein [Kitasatospora herbaricolor]MDQ0305831.1 hypothetical protein [Kitasatospora herbaricolor]